MNNDQMEQTGTSRKMVGLNPATSKITLNISDLTTPIKKQRLFN